MLDSKKGERSIFLEANNQYVHSSQYNDEVLNQYAAQIRSAFPESANRIKQILSRDEPIVVRKKEQDDIKELIQKVLKNKEIKADKPLEVKTPKAENPDSAPSQ